MPCQPISWGLAVDLERLEILWSMIIAGCAEGKTICGLFGINYLFSEKKKSGVLVVKVANLKVALGHDEMLRGLCSSLAIVLTLKVCKTV